MSEVKTEAVAAGKSLKLVGCETYVVGEYHFNKGGKALPVKAEHVEYLESLRTEADKPVFAEATAEDEQAGAVAQAPEGGEGEGGEGGEGGDGTIDTASKPKGNKVVIGKKGSGETATV